MFLSSAALFTLFSSCTVLPALSLYHVMRDIAWESFYFVNITIDVFCWVIHILVLIFWTHRPTTFFTTLCIAACFSHAAKVGWTIVGWLLLDAPKDTDLYWAANFTFIVLQSFVISAVVFNFWRLEPTNHDSSSPSPVCPLDSGPVDSEED